MFDVVEFIDAAYSDCQSLTDEGDQLHRRAVTGRFLKTHMHGWDATANNGAGGMAVTLRIEGQYVNRGQRFVGSTSAAAQEFAALANAALGEMPAPVPGKPFSAGRPTEMTDGKRVNVYLDAASLARAAEMGAGNVSEGIRLALAARPE